MAGLGNWEVGLPGLGKEVDEFGLGHEIKGEPMDRQLKLRKLKQSCGSEPSQGQRGGRSWKLRRGPRGEGVLEGSLQRGQAERDVFSGGETRAHVKAARRREPAESTRETDALGKHLWPCFLSSSSPPASV